jgi:hypothetical protein
MSTLVRFKINVHLSKPSASNKPTSRKPRTLNRTERIGRAERTYRAEEIVSISFVLRKAR